MSSYIYIIPDNMVYVKKIVCSKSPYKQERIAAAILLIAFREIVSSGTKISLSIILQIKVGNGYPVNT